MTRLHLFIPFFLLLGLSAQDSAADLHLAVSTGDIAEVKALLKRGMPVDALLTGGWTPLMVAAKYGQTIAAQELLINKARVDSANQEGNTALIVAVTSDKPEIVRLLLSYGANIHIKNKQGLDAAEIANLLGKQMILGILREPAKPKEKTKGTGSG